VPTVATPTDRTDGRLRGDVTQKPSRGVRLGVREVAVDGGPGHPEHLGDVGRVDALLPHAARLVGGGGGRPGGSSCAATDCDCDKFLEAIDARVPLGKDNLTAA
jgi:hypothetical protein